MRSHTSILHATIALALATAWPACGGDTVAPPPPPPVTPTVASVTVTPSTALLQVIGETVQFSATARDANGAAISSKTFTWGSSNETVASVDASGLATAHANGAATVTATVDGVAGSADMTVQLAPTTGALRLTTATAGRNLDPDGYMLVVTGVITQAIGPVDTITVGDLDPGTYAANIDGLSANCHRFSDEPATGDVVAGDTTDVELGVECLSVPDEITLTYQRAHLDPTSVRVAGQPAAGGTPVDLTFHPLYDGDPDWSPDGSRLAFSRGGYGGDIFVVNADGTDLRSFGDRALGAGRGANPAWSPDGTKIAYDNETDIYVIEPDGTEPQVHLGAGYWPAWSPDGTKIAFEVYDPPTEPEIFIMNADGSGRVNITNQARMLDREPTWSPDGSQIAFRRLDRDAPFGQRDYDLWIMDADGGNQTKVLTRDGPQVHPIWLPDNRILFVSNVPLENGYRILALDLDAGGTVTQLTSETGYAGHVAPAWRPTPGTPASRR